MYRFQCQLCLSLSLAVVLFIYQERISHSHQFAVRCAVGLQVLLCRSACLNIYTSYRALAALNTFNRIFAELFFSLSVNVFFRCFSSFWYFAHRWELCMYLSMCACFHRALTNTRIATFLIFFHIEFFPRQTFIIRLNFVRFFFVAISK